MMNTRYFFIEPLDVLMLRGNKGFGATGEHGEALMPPWPSVFAGAFRSALLANDAQRLAAYSAIASHDQYRYEEEREDKLIALLGSTLFNLLGTPAQPGSFRLCWASLGVLTDAEKGTAKIALPLPADLLAATQLTALQPCPWPTGNRGSQTLPLVALLRTAKQVKPEGGHWLDSAGLNQHLSGNAVSATVAGNTLYRQETRLGIALDPASRSASDGALYTTEAVSFCHGAGFVVGIDGLAAGSTGAQLLPSAGLLRLGGDGKAARYREVHLAQPPMGSTRQVAATIPQARFRLILSTPGLFTQGWLPEGVTQQGTEFHLQGPGFRARLACAALGRHDVVSGWDLLRWAPKVAQRVAPAGSVYWFDQFEGEPGKLADWVASGLWADTEALSPEQRQRRAEGFNNAMLAAWL